MIVEYVRYSLTHHTPEELVAAYAAAGPHLQAAPECLGYDLTICADAPESVVVRIHWQSAEAHLQGFRPGPNFPPFLALVRPFLDEMAEMRHYEPTAVRWAR